MNEKLITPMGDTILLGCNYNYCRYCEYDPYPYKCHNILMWKGNKLEIKEIRK